MFLIGNQGEQHIFLSNYKISTFFKKIKTASFAEWSDIVTAGNSCSFSFLFKSDFIFQEKLSHNFWPCSAHSSHRLKKCRKLGTLKQIWDIEANLGKLIGLIILKKWYIKKLLYLLAFICFLFHVTGWPQQIIFSFPGNLTDFTLFLSFAFPQKLYVFQGWLRSSI